MSKPGYWTEYFEDHYEEISAYVERHITKTTAEVMAKYFNCHVNTMRRWMRQLGYHGGIRCNAEKITTKDIAEMIGIPDNQFIRSWKRNGFKPKRCAGYTFSSFEEVEDFMKSHPTLWDANLCDPLYFSGLEWFEEIKRNGNNKIVKKRWLPQEVSLLRVLWENGKSVKDISFRLDRSEEAVKKKLYKYYGGLTDGHRIKKV